MGAWLLHLKLLSILGGVIGWCLLGLAAPTVVSKVVGRVGDYYLTSREVIASRWLEKTLFPDPKSPNVSESLGTAEFSNQVTSAILEKVVSVEAESFSVAAVTDEEIKNSTSKAMKGLETNKNWEKLAISNAEIQNLIARKIRSKKFLKYKTDAAVLTVTDFEVKEYYEKSRYKFGNLPLESFKENIRQFLIQRQTEDRLREWFEVLRKKYQVRNFQAEAG
jgi:hypothetical protein